MSIYQVQKCLFDYLRAREHAPKERRVRKSPTIDTEGYDLSDTERKALESKDIGEIYVMGVHPVIVNGYCRASWGTKRADYRPMLEAAAVKTEPRKVTDGRNSPRVFRRRTRRCMSADKESAPPDQAARFFGGLDKVRRPS